MFPLLLLGLLGFALASRRGSSSSTPKPPSSSAKPAATQTDIAKRIVAETKEILDGKREAYTDDSEDVDAELERARQAVALAKQKEAQTPASASSSSSTPRPAPQSTMSVGPISQPKPAAAAKPAAAGTDLALAKSTAAKVAAHLKQAGRDKYDRKALRLWQTRAGLEPDGIYGKGTAAALKYFGAKPPAPFFNQGTASYTPPA